MGNVTDSLLATYRNAASAHADATLHGGSDRANRAYDTLAEIYLKLRRLNELDRLLEVLDDEDPGAKLWAATHLLHTAPYRAEPVLRELANRVDILGMIASMTVHEWKGGRLKPPA